MLPDSFISANARPAPMKLPHLRIDCANPKQAERLVAGERSPISASRGAACGRDAAKQMGGV